MQITQFYQTTIIDRDSEAKGQFIVLPRRAFSNLDLLPSEEHEEGTEGGIEQFLELVHTLIGVRPTMIPPFQLPYTVAQCLAMSTPEMLEDPESLIHTDPQYFFSQSMDLMSFAEILALAPVVPFEQSPLALDSVSSLITKATGAGLGAYVGFVVAGGPSPLIFVTIPAGMIVIGAAKGVASALEKGLEERLLKLIIGSPRKKSKSKSSKKA